MFKVLLQGFLGIVLSCFLEIIWLFSRFLEQIPVYVDATRYPEDTVAKAMGW